MVDESEIRIDALNAEAMMFKKQAESTNEMMKNVRFNNSLFRPYP
jgi:E3 ubiquitin-protein ligase BRE1